MKIFYKKDYLRALVEINEKNKNQKILEEQNENQKKYISIYLDTIENMHQKMHEMNEEIKKLFGAKGGLTRRVNSLVKQNEELKKELSETISSFKKEKVELEKKLADSMTDKYIVKKLKPGKKPNTLTMAVRGSSVQSNIVKNLYKE